jgi:DNA-binding CsgD family transcriptional regulator
MNLLRWLDRWLSRRNTRKREYAFDEELLVSLERLAVYRRSTPQKVAAELVDKELHSVDVELETWQKWQSLSEREREVVALVCLHYKTSQIAQRLGIAPETVRSHVHNVLIKFGLPNRMELRYLLADWDFGAWE